MAQDSSSLRYAMCHACCIVGAIMAICQNVHMIVVHLPAGSAGIRGPHLSATYGRMSSGRTSLRRVDTASRRVCLPKRVDTRIVAGYLAVVIAESGQPPLFEPEIADFALDCFLPEAEQSFVVLQRSGSATDTCTTLVFQHAGAKLPQDKTRPVFQSLWRVRPLAGNRLYSPAYALLRFGSPSRGRSRRGMTRLGHPVTNRRAEKASPPRAAWRAFRGHHDAHRTMHRVSLKASASRPQ